MGNTMELCPVSTTNQLMPLMHCTDFFSFRQIIRSGRLDPTPCKVFNKELLYLFYGRPAYKASYGEKKSFTNKAYLPVTFILETEKIHGIEQIYPFDSGAYSHGYFNEYIHPKSRLEDFMINRDTKVLPNLISNFYGNNISYFFGETRPMHKPAIDNVELNTYYDIINSTGNLDIDDRKYTIEVVINKSILLKELLYAIVLPLCIMDEELINKLNIWSAKIYNYPSFVGGNIDVQNGAMRTRVFDALKEGGYFD